MSLSVFSAHRASVLCAGAQPPAKKAKPSKGGATASKRSPSQVRRHHGVESVGHVHWTPLPFLRPQMEAARFLDQMKSDGILSASADEIKQASVKQPLGRVQALAAFNQPGGLARRDDAYTAEPGDHHHFVGLYTPAGFEPPAAGSSPCDLLLVMARCSINEDPNLIGTPFAVDAGALGTVAAHRPWDRTSPTSQPAALRALTT
jgi:hypothetical protein